MAQEYDKNGNRTRMHRNTVGGYESDYGNSEDLSYTYNVVNQLTAISDADDGGFSCTVTCDNNNNITQIEEVQTSGINTATLTTDFTYDWGNRLTQHKTTQYNNAQEDSWITKRGHTIDAIGRTAKSSYLTYWNTDLPGSPDTLEHVYDRARHIQNYDGSTYGEVWHWAGAANQHSAPLRSPNADTASQKAYNIANDHTPQRRTFTNPTSEGDQRNLYGQGKPQAKNSSGAGANWYFGTASEGLAAVTVNSRTMFEGTVTATDMDRATDAREKGRIGIFGTGNAYAGSYGRVTSERIGRDLNPLGRGDAIAYVGGALRMGRLAHHMPNAMAPSGTGNSINNPGDGGLNGPGARVDEHGCQDTPVSNAMLACAIEWAEKYEDNNDFCVELPSCDPDVCGQCTAAEWKSDPLSCMKLRCCCNCWNTAGGWGDNPYGVKTYCDDNPHCCPPCECECVCGNGSNGNGGDGFIQSPPKSPPIDPNPCDEYNDIIPVLFDYVCRKFDSCADCLPEKTKMCLKSLCSNMAGNIKLVCSGSRCNKFNGYYPIGQAQCQVTTQTIWVCFERIINKAKGNVSYFAALAYVLGHEMLHACDCNFWKHQNNDPKCRVLDPGEFDSRSEGFAESCTRAS